MRLARPVPPVCRRRLSSWCGAPVLVLGNGAAGAEKQALALADALGLEHTLVRWLPSQPAMRLPLRAQLTAQAVLGPSSIGVEIGEQERRTGFPLLAISCGRASVPASVALRRASVGQTVTVHIQKPLCSTAEFDMVIAPRHDYTSLSSVPANVVLTDGALSGVTASALDQARQQWEEGALALPQPRIALLIGGAMVRRWWHRPLAPMVDARAVSELLRSACNLLSSSGSGSLLVTTSRRTPAAVVEVIRTEVERARSLGLGIWLWSGPQDGPNPYLGMLAWSDVVVVTPDSISMASEVAGARLPLYIPWIDACQGRFLTFHSILLASGRAQHWPPDSSLKSHGSGLFDDHHRLTTCLEAQGVYAATDRFEDDVCRAARRVAQLIIARAALGEIRLDSQVELQLRAVACMGPLSRRRSPRGMHARNAVVLEASLSWPLRAYFALSEVVAPVLAAASAWKARRPEAFLEALALCHPANAAMGLDGDGADSPNRYVLWVHGASVGESLSVLPLVRALLQSSPSAHVLFTASTETALRRLSLERLGPRVKLLTRAVDAPSVQRRVISKWKPSALILVESELWPAMLLEAQRAQVPTALVNGRLSPTSLRRWTSMPALRKTLTELLQVFDVILAQSEPMADLLAHFAGEGVAAPECVGDLKQMRAGAPPSAAQVEELCNVLGVAGSRLVWLAASTHDGEEEVALRAHEALRREHSNLMLVIAPRHTGRGAAVASLARSHGWSVERRCVWHMLHARAEP